VTKFPTSTKLDGMMADLVAEFRAMEAELQETRQERDRLAGDLFVITSEKAAVDLYFQSQIETAINPALLDGAASLSETYTALVKCEHDPPGRWTGSIHGHHIQADLERAFYKDKWLHAEYQIRHVSETEAVASVEEVGTA